tara:strand:+ start:1996 stop:2430 length:435 start_codon:yes stop_codon:yes gene_type:complete
MIEIVVGCLFPMLLTANNLPIYQNCLQVQENIVVVSRHTDMVSRYFKEEDILLALNVIYCESSGRTSAVGNNKNGTQDVGLWQFNDDTWSWLKSKLGIIGNRTDPEVSTAVAAWLVYNDGWHHWNSSKICWKDFNNKYLHMEET